ncbi:hypothetical protein IU448_10770 [Nocardia flavorosea]|nr:hypothetical protein [Nocardia carnea]MBF6349502.1 hypothetical protein [Nocardia flavorosea]
MRQHGEPIAFGWVDDEVSTAPDWDRAQVSRLARRLGYRLVWPDMRSLLPVADQVRNAAAEVVIMPAPAHLGPLELNRVMDNADVETVLPRLSFARWSTAGTGR